MEPDAADSGAGNSSGNPTPAPKAKSGSRSSSKSSNGGCPTPEASGFTAVSLSVAKEIFQKRGAKLYAVYHPVQAAGVFVSVPWSKLIATWQNLQGEQKFNLESALEDLRPLVRNDASLPFEPKFFVNLG